jgi:hypothetical protein
MRDRAIASLGESGYGVALVAEYVVAAASRLPAAALPQVQPHRRAVMVRANSRSKTR